MAPVTRSLLRAPVVAALLATGLLAGCGSAPDVHPGEAAVVGGEEISLDRVDAMATDLCTLATPGLEADGSVLPMSLLRGQALAILVRDELLWQFAEAEGLDLDGLRAEAADVAAQRLDADRSGGELPEGAADELHEQYTLDAGAGLILDHVGKEALGQQPGGPVSEESVGRGYALFQEWRDSVTVTRDPRFSDVDLDLGRVTPPGGSLSRLVGSSPVETGYAADGSVDQEYVATLPPEQRCGTPKAS